MFLRAQLLRMAALMTRFHGRIGKGAAMIAKKLRREESEARNAKTPIGKTRQWRRDDFETHLAKTRAGA